MERIGKKLKNKINQLKNIIIQENFIEFIKKISIYLKKNLKKVLICFPPIDFLIFYFSIVNLKKRIKAEENIDDILETAGYYKINYKKINAEEWEDPQKISYERKGVELCKGKYEGYGKYRFNLCQEKESIKKLLKRVKSLGPSVIMEIGTASGGSLYTWCRYLKDLEMIISIDFDFNGREKLFKSFAPEKEMHFIEGDSHDQNVFEKVSKILKSKKVDFIYIDADHSYEGVKKDFEMYKRFASNNTIIGLHDICHFGTGVPKFWKEIKRFYKTEEFGEKLQKNGLVYLKRV